VEAARLPSSWSRSRCRSWSPRCGGTPRLLTGSSSARSARPRSPGRGRHRPRTGVPGRARGNAARGLAPNRPLRQQPRPGRPRPIEGAPAAMRGLKQDRSARVIIAGHALVQNVWVPESRSWALSRVDRGSLSRTGGEFRLDDGRIRSTFAPPDARLRGTARNWRGTPRNGRGCRSAVCARHG
jgi:hypothetical protein